MRRSIMGDMSGAARAGTLFGPPRPEPTPVAPASHAGPIITRVAERALRVELDRRRHELEVEFAARLREARTFGAAGGNDDYLQIKEEEAVLASGDLDRHPLGNQGRHQTRPSL